MFPFIGALMQIDGNLGSGIESNACRPSGDEGSCISTWMDSAILCIEGSWMLTGSAISYFEESWLSTGSRHLLSQGLLDLYWLCHLLYQESPIP